MTTTPKGVPYPESTDPNNAPGDIKAVADWLNANPGIAAMTTVQRNALTGAQVWPGRTIFNTATGRHEVNPTGVAGAQKWQSLPRLPQVWSLAGPAAGRWTLPEGVTRIRLILVGAGGRGGNNSNGTLAIGGGGGGVIDATLPASMIEHGEIEVTVGGPTYGNGDPTSARVTDPDSFLPELSAFGGRSGTGPTPGAGGGFHAAYLTDDERPSWLGYKGNQAVIPAVTIYPPIARGPGAGLTLDRDLWRTYTQRAGGIIAKSGDPTLGFMGGGGAEPAANGYFPGGGGAGAWAHAPNVAGSGAPGVAVIISYFDE